MTMVTSRTYHALHLDIATYPSERICYVILPEKFKESEHSWPLSAVIVFVNHTSIRMDMLSDTEKDSGTPRRMKMHLELMNGKDI